MDTKNAVVIITGGASGIGQACAMTLAQAGAKIAIVDNNIDGAQTVASKVSGLAVGGDVTSSDSMEEAVKTICAHYKEPIRVLINCAGVATPKRMVEKTGPQPLEAFTQVVNINLLGTFNVMRLVSDRMIKNTPNEDNERGVIINTASIAAFDGQVGQAAYSASKGGIVAMTLPLARELSRFGVRVMSIAPGLMDTPMLQGLSEEVASQLQEMTPFPKRFGKTKEFAALAKHIIENPMLNGETIRLDGALRMN